MPSQTRSRQRVAGQLRRRLAWIGAAVLATTLSLPASSPALAPAPVWSLSSEANTTAAPGGAPGALKYLLEVKNAGNADSTAPSNPTCDPNNPPVDPACLVFTATLPSGLTAVDVSPANGFAFGSATCSGLGVPGPTTITCASPDVITTARHSDPGSFRVFILSTTVDPGTFGVLTTSFEVRGGGAATPSDTVDPTRITATLPGFGVDGFDGQVTDAAGDSFTQAGGHPYAASTSIDFNTRENANFLIGSVWPIEPTKDVVVDLPPGFVGNPTVVDKCTTPELAREDGKPLCPPSSQVGTTLIRINGSIGGTHVLQGPTPVFSMVAPPGVPARFGFNLAGSVVTLDAQLRSGSDYGFTVNADNVPEGIAVAGTSLTLWGVPADSSHDSERACAGELPPALSGPTCATGTPRKAFLRNPTSCVPSPGSPVTDGLVTGLHIDSWAHPARHNADDSPDLSDPLWQSTTFVTHNPPAYPSTPGQWGSHQLPTGCASVPFTPSLSVKLPPPARSGTPSAFSFDVELPQGNEPHAIAESDLRSVLVTLPAGLRLSPSSADGLQGCSPQQLGLHTTADVSCPDASKVGSVTITTPLLEEQLSGSVYLATPHENPFNSLLAVYLVVKGSGVIVKVAGRVSADPTTGQLTASFDDQPQLPFSKLHLELTGGPRAPLVTPSTCGTYTTTSQLTSWSGKTVVSPSSFTLDRGPDGGACASLGFSPSFSAGTLSGHAASFSPFTTTIARSDSDQELAGIQVKTPPGLLGMLSSVPLCDESQAAQGTCSAASQIGHTTVSAGAGSNPISLPVPGQPANPVYLTQSYKGAPFGLSVVVPAIAGPFNLGTVVVRAQINVDKSTGQITITSDPLPRILQGIPLQVRQINITVDRPGFTFNPTSCEPMSVGATIASTEGATANVSSPFQAVNCANLAFKPSFTASTQGHTSKLGGASLDVKVSTKQGPGQTPGEANIAKVAVQLPLQLPSRLTTLQKACTAAQFDANPAGCPAESLVGTAVAHTPVLPVPLQGPAYLVSHGGAAFPDLVIVLQGDGIRIDLTGNTQIKKGVTFSRFETVPDAPISSFELKLPQGPHSALAANGNLCAPTKTVTKRVRVTRRVHGHVKHSFKTVRKTVTAPLSMPTTITAQNGAVLRQTTRIAVSGCPATKAKAKSSKKAKANRRGRHG